MKIFFKKKLFVLLLVVSVVFSLSPFQVAHAWWLTDILTGGMASLFENTFGSLGEFIAVSFFDPFTAATFCVAGLICSDSSGIRIIPPSETITEGKCVLKVPITFYIPSFNSGIVSVLKYDNGKDILNLPADAQRYRAPRQGEPGYLFSINVDGYQSPFPENYECSIPDPYGGSAKVESGYTWTDGQKHTICVPLSPAYERGPIDETHNKIAIYRFSWSAPQFQTIAGVFNSQMFAWWFFSTNATYGYGGAFGDQIGTGFAGWYDTDIRWWRGNYMASLYPGYYLPNDGVQPLAVLNYSDICNGNVCTVIDADNVPQDSYVFYVAKILGSYSEMVWDFSELVWEPWIYDNSIALPTKILSTKPNKFLSTASLGSGSFAALPYLFKDGYALGNIIRGPYKTGTVSLADCGIGTGPQINITPSSLSFTATANSASVITKNSIIKNSGQGDSVLNWSAVSSAPWITFSPSSGALRSETSAAAPNPDASGVCVSDSNGESNSVYCGGIQGVLCSSGYTCSYSQENIAVSVNPASLSAGTYTGTITVSDPNASNSPQTINVSLVVSASGGSSETYSCGRCDTNYKYTWADFTATSSVCNASTVPAPGASINYTKSCPCVTGVTTYNAAWNAQCLAEAANPTVDLKVNYSDSPSSVEAPADLVVSWATTNPEKIVSGSGIGTGQGWAGAKSINGGNDTGGNLNNIPAGTYTYSITFNKVGGGTISDSVSIVVSTSGTDGSDAIGIPECGTPGQDPCVPQVPCQYPTCPPVPIELQPPFCSFSSTPSKLLPPEDKTVISWSCQRADKCYFGASVLPFGYTTSAAFCSAISGLMVGGYCQVNNEQFTSPKITIKKNIDFTLNCRNENGITVTTSTVRLAEPDINEVNPQ